MNNARKILYCCCSPLVDENYGIKKLKPFLLASILILLIVICFDFFLFETNIYIYISFSVFPIFILVVKRFYYLYTINLIYFSFLIFPKIINDIGTYFQIEILTPVKIIILCLKIFCLILLILVQYFFFTYYKELKFQYLIQRPNQKHMKEKDNTDSEKEKFISKKLSNIIIPDDNDSDYYQ